MITSINLERRNLASGLKLLFELCSLFCCFFLLSASAFRVSWADLVLLNSWSASPCRSFNESSFELHTQENEIHIFSFFGLSKELEWKANLANRWSNFLTKTSQDLGFVPSMFIKELITALMSSGSSAMAYITNTKHNKNQKEQKFYSCGKLPKACKTSILSNTSFSSVQSSLLFCHPIPPKENIIEVSSYILFFNFILFYNAKSWYKKSSCRWLIIWLNYI